ncbi:MAG: phosphatase PAP2 family protein [Candidatus Bipolaricaulota bacterium]|nr:phosphatase PAP2 family protein [Candidatus Bipolaricaulota bacterium]
MFQWSLALAVLAVFVSAISALGTFNPTGYAGYADWYRSHQGILSILLDSALWHLVAGALLLAVGMYGILRIKRPFWGGNLWRVTLLLGLMVVALLVEVAVEKYVFKPSLAVPRPAGIFEPGTITRFVDAGLAALGLGMPTDGLTSTPSGFAIRQTLVLLGILLYGWRFLAGKPRLRGALVGVSAFASLLALAGRVLTGAHTPRDVLLGLAIGLVVFWLVFALVQLVKEEPLYLQNWAIPGATAFIGIEFFCHNPTMWLITGAMTSLVVFAAYYVFAVIRRTPTGEGH